MCRIHIRHILLTGLVLTLLVALCACGVRYQSHSAPDIGASNATDSDTAGNTAESNDESAVDESPVESVFGADNSDVVEVMDEQEEFPAEMQNSVDKDSMVFSVDGTLGSGASYSLTLDFSKYSSEPTAGGMRYYLQSDPDTFIDINYVSGQSAGEHIKAIPDAYLNGAIAEFPGDKSIRALDIEAEHVTGNDSESNIEAWVTDVPGGCAEFVLMWPVSGSPSELYSAVDTLAITF
ncbi:MAG: hypothetical protein IJG63_07235 [Oscillospiraceae bacterium]|nr:hypothetical protein [Oscillospiraceae bacterium]